MLRIIRYGAVALIGVFVLGSLAVGLGWLQSGPAVTNTGAVMVGRFQLVDQKNQPVGEREVLGKPAVLLFGFTYCPEVCPTMLASLTAALGQLGPAGDRLNVFFVTVDPARDTPDVLAKYLSAFDPRIRGLTGAPDQIAAIAKPLGVYFARVDVEGGGYTMDHTANAFLLDAQGHFVATIAYGEDPKTALEKLRRLAGA